MLAQESLSHYSFQGIEMNMKVGAFSTELSRKGYAILYAKEDSTACILSGTFAGKDDCSIIVFGTPKSKIVWKVSILFPETKSWYSVKNNYMTLVESYTKKYGNPQKHFEFFSSPYEEGDGYEISAISLEKCHYLSMFEKDNVTILIRINKGDVRTACVNVSYEDKINQELMKKEKSEIVDDDI